MKKHPMNARPLLALLVLLALVASCKSTDEIEREQHAEVANFCKAPKALERAPEIAKVIFYYTDDDPAFPPDRKGRWFDANNGFWVPSSLLPSRRDAETGNAGYIACLDIKYEIIDKKTYYDGTSPTVFYRTLAHWTVKLYNLHTGALIAEDKGTGEEPPEFESNFTDIVRYRGNLDEKQIRRFLQRSIKAAP